MRTRGKLSLPTRLLRYAESERGLHLLLAAALLHVSVVAIIFAIGRGQALPSHFDDNGIGIFAADSYLYQNEVISLAAILKTKGIVAWASWPSQLHVRLYSLSYAAFSRWSSFNILTTEPLNLIYYLLMLVLVFKLGREIGDRRAGLIAAIIVAAWPSLLLHTTQLLRDPLLIVVMLALMLIISRALARDYSWRAGLLAAASASVVLLIIFIVRAAMWDIVRVACGLCLALMLVRWWRERRVLAGSLILLAALLSCVFVIPRLGGFFENQRKSPSEPDITARERLQNLPLWERIAERRDKFIEESRRGQAQSNIDDDVRFHNATDIALYLPRATLIGLLAPFPPMWLRGNLRIGFAGSLVAGLETCLMYINCLLILYALGERYGHLSFWLLLLLACAGTVALGLVVVNVGALYRLRYIYWILLVVLGAQGAARLSRLKDDEDLLDQKS